MVKINYLSSLMYLCIVFKPITSFPYTYTIDNGFWVSVLILIVIFCLVQKVITIWNVCSARMFFFRIVYSLGKRIVIINCFMSFTICFSSYFPICGDGQLSSYLDMNQSDAYLELVYTIREQHIGRYVIPAQ